MHILWLWLTLQILKGIGPLNLVYIEDYVEETSSFLKSLSKPKQRDPFVIASELLTAAEALLQSCIKRGEPEAPPQLGAPLSHIRVSSHSFAL